MYENIILIGMPGAGKSTVGIVLAKMMGYDFLDADLVIQDRCDNTLQRIIDACGPEGFIEVENEILKEITVSKTVVATGGSAVYSSEAMGNLAEEGIIVYLSLSCDEMIKRLQNLHERGVVMKAGIGMNLPALYEERKPLYEKYAEITVPVDNLSLTEAAQKIMQAVEHRIQPR